MNVNFISALLVHLWVAGWALAAIRAGWKAKAVKVTSPAASLR